MANRYWVGGTASWDGTAGTKWALTSGGAGGQAVPTSADDVFFDAASGANTVTIASGNTGAKSINCTGFTGTIAGSTAITVSGSITLVAGMTYTHTARITMNGTGTLTTGGKQLSNLTLGGSGVTITLGDNLTTTTANGQIQITTGTFTTNNFNVTSNRDGFEVTGAATLNFGSSTITANGTGAYFDFSPAGMVLNAGTSTLTTDRPTFTFNGGGKTFYNLSFTSTTFNFITLNGANTFNNLTFAERASSGSGTVTFTANQTVNGTFTVQSGATNPSKRILFESNAIGTARTITSASNNIFGVDFRDITAAGVASWNDSSRTGYWGNCTGNSGITFATGRTVYWNLAGAQNWSATGWTNTSTGTPDAQYFPLAQDTATFTNAGSVTGTITINASFNIGTMDMSGRTSAMTLASSAGFTPVVYGNWTNGSGTTLSLTQALILSGRVTQTITSAGKTFPVATTIDSPSGTVQLADAFVCSAAVTLTRGTLNASGYNFTALTFASSNTNTRTITMGSGLWTLTDTGTVWETGTITNLTFNKDTANILLSNTTTTARTFSGGGLTYNKLTIGGATGTSTLIISGANTFSELASTKTVAHTISFSANQTITIWSVAGTSGNVVTVNSSTAGTARTLTITNRTSGINYLNILDITASLAPITFYAGANTLLRSNVQGVAAIAPTANEYIYVLNTGTSFTVPANWNSSNNEIHLFAAGGGGGGGRYTSATSRAGGGGGGGGGYTKVTNLTLTPSSSVSYAIGAAGAAGSSGGGSGGAGGNTTFNAGTYTTVGGGGGSTTTTPTSTGGVAGTGSTTNGGVGGTGAVSTVSATGTGGGGGAGAGGALGVGANGGNGFASATQTQIAGGGGGGNGGGSVGGNASASLGGTGGNNNAGVGGGSAGTDGFNGGGGGGTSSGNAGSGGSGIDISNAGMGSGGGGGGGADSSSDSPQRGGIFGGGGGGGGVNIATNSRNGAGGAQGGIIIWYSAGAAPASNSNFFLMFG